MATYTAHQGASKVQDALKELAIVFVAAFVPIFVAAANGLGPTPNLDAAGAFGRALFYGAIAAAVKAVTWYATTQVEYPTS